jgi:precorrin-8X/cobalt-precorrin-8 methylmutase
MAEPLAYLRDPAAIYEASWAAIRREAPLGRLPPEVRPVAMRLIHACGMVDILDDLAFTPDAVAAGRSALRSGAPILTDAGMVAAGIRHEGLQAGNEIVCTLDDPRTKDLAAARGTTRSAVAVELWQDRLEGAVVAIGNAPTALFHLLEQVAAGGPRPAAVLGIPVGFVGSAESKLALVENPWDLPYLVVHGRRGGSALCASALNALAQEAEIA